MVSWQLPNCKVQVLFEREALQLFSWGGGFKAMGTKQWLQAAPASQPALCIAEERQIDYPPSNRISEHLAGPVNYQDGSSSLSEEGTALGGGGPGSGKEAVVQSWDTGTHKAWGRLEQPFFPAAISA